MALPIPLLPPMITMFFISVINQLYKLRQVYLLVSKIIFRNFIVIDLSLHGTFKRPRGIRVIFHVWFY
jgi:hypothetical protein